MSDQFVTKFKFFWDDADHALEDWLQQMARQGLHLHKVGFLRCWFVFRRGAPAEMSYRLDFQAKRTKADYFQLFSDAGWQHVDQVLGWHFWRVPVRAGRTPEIFTDVESRIRKYQRLIWLFAFAWLPFFIMLPFSDASKFWNTPRDIVLTLAVAGVALYAVLRLILRIRRLRNPVP